MDRASQTIGIAARAISAHSHPASQGPPRSPRRGGASASSPSGNARASAAPPSRTSAIRARRRDARGVILGHPAKVLGNDRLHCECGDAWVMSADGLVGNLTLVVGHERAANLMTPVLWSRARSGDSEAFGMSSSATRGRSTTTASAAWGAGPWPRISSRSSSSRRGGVAQVATAR